MVTFYMYYDYKKKKPAFPSPPSCAHKKYGLRVT